MKIITLAAQKGGCGKSSLAISCAVLAARGSSRVLLLDLDPQASALEWQAGRNGNPPQVRRVRCLAPDIEQALADVAQQDLDFVFIDTPGQDEFGVPAAISQASMTLIPCRPTMVDIRAMPATAELARGLGCAFAFVLTQVPTRGTRADETAAELAAFGEVAPVRVSQRMAWQDAYAASLGVSEYEPKGAAARELGALWRWLNIKLKGLEHG